MHELCGLALLACITAGFGDTVRTGRRSFDGNLYKKYDKMRD